MKFETVTKDDGSTWQNYVCPGCSDWHSIRTSGIDRYLWDGDRRRPTVSPSIIVGADNDKPCHAMITNGKATFFSPSHHGLAGKTVTISDYPLPLAMEAAA